MAEITDYDFKHGEDWLCWGDGGFETVLEKLRALGVGLGPRDGIETSMTNLDRQMNDDWTMVGCGVWIPELETGRPRGLMTANMIPLNRRTAVPRNFWRRYTGPQPKRGESWHDFASEWFDTPSGRMLLTSARVTDKQGVARFELRQYYLPQDCLDGMCLAFITYDAEAYLTMVEESKTFSETLEFEIATDAHDG